MPGYLKTREAVMRELYVQMKRASQKLEPVLNIPAIMGPVGAGKTSMARSIAIELEVPLCAINSGENSDATDLSGCPTPSLIANNGKPLHEQYMLWMLNRYAVMACNEPVLLFFDDLDKAPPPVQSALLGILGNRMFRDRHIHPGTIIMCAGNRIGDDEYASQLSESLRTRITIIEMEPDITSFTKYASESGAIHPAIIGYLHHKPEHLHQWKDGVNRFPTPRGWEEASWHMEEFPDPFEDGDNWKQIVARKCGDHVANDFWAWFSVVSKIDVEHALTTGDLKTPANGSDATRRMMQYAAIFAISRHLAQHGVQPKHVGLPKLIKEMQREMRVAFVVQLTPKVRADISTMFKDAAETLMKDLVASPEEAPQEEAMT